MKMWRACAERIARSRSPTSSMIASKSSCFARAAPISLMTASSAARCSVSARRCFVSVNKRAFSRATPMLEANVPSRRSSDSVKPNCSSRSSPITPRTRSPARIGTPSHDSASSLPTVMAPCALVSAAVFRRSGCRVEMTVEVNPGPSAKGFGWIRAPSSMK